MPHYFISEEEVNLHQRYHQQGLLLELKGYCSICCPILNTLDYPIGFITFWNWLRTNYSAQHYNGFTLDAYSQLEDSLIQEDTVISRKLLASINFETLTLHIDELSFYLRNLYTATNGFRSLPTGDQELEAKRAYRSQLLLQSPQQPPHQPPI